MPASNGIARGCWARLKSWVIYEFPRLLVGVVQVLIGINPEYAACLFLDDVKRLLKCLATKGASKDDAGLKRGAESI